MVFGDKIPELFCDDKKMVFNDRKIRYVFICFKRMKKIFLRREFHSKLKFMRHELNKKQTQTQSCFIFFSISKNLHALKKSDLY